MGQAFTNGLTNTALADPSTGQTQWFPNNPAGNAGALSAWAQGQTRFQPSLTSIDANGNRVPLDPSQQSSAAPMLVHPTPQQAAAVGAAPGGIDALSPGLTKAGKLITLLSSGIQGALAGRAAQEQTIAQTGGRRAGGFGTGFQAGVTLPWQRAMLPLQYQQQAAQTALAQAGAQPVNTPYGPMPAEFASRSLLPWMVRGQAQTEAAQIGANARVQSANIGAQNRLDVVGLQTAIASNKGAKFLPDVDPQTGQNFYHVLNPYGQEIGRTDVTVIPSLMARQSTSVDYKQLDDGSIVALPKTTTSRPMVDLSGQGKPAAPSSQNGLGVPIVVKDAQGNPLAGKGSTTSTTRTMVETAPKVLDLIDRLRGQIQGLDQSGALGPGMSRWNDFWSGKVGTDNPDFRAMKTNADLLSTLLMRMHVGARGGELIMKHFDDMLGAGHESAANMLSTLQQLQLYANDVQNSAPRPVDFGKGGGANRPPLSSFEH